jgi:urease accessory protein UreH
VANRVSHSLDSRPAAAVGRDARLELVFERRGGRTVVVHAYAEPPFRVGRPFDLEGTAHLIIVCAGPGIFAGDSFRQAITVGPGARVVLTSQSALQIHASPAERPATISHQIDLVGDAELHCRWHPVIPFAESRAVHRVELRLGGEARLSWSDALMAGRVSRGETWRFAELDHELRVRIGGATRYLERYRIAPARRSPDRAWVAGGAHYFGTMLVRHAAATPDAAEALHRALQAVASVGSAVDAPEPGLIIARLMAARGASFSRARSVCGGAVLDAVFGRPELVGLRSV